MSTYILNNNNFELLTDFELLNIDGGSATGLWMSIVTGAGIGGGTVGYVTKHPVAAVGGAVVGGVVGGLFYTFDW